MKPQPQIALHAGTQWVTVEELPKLIATALHPEDESEPLVTELEKIPHPPKGAPKAMPLDEGDRRFLESLWSRLPPLRLPIPLSQFADYLTLAQETMKIGWKLGYLVKTPSLHSAISRNQAFNEHKKALSTAIQRGIIESRDPISNLPQALPTPGGRIAIEPLRQYLEQLGIEVKVTLARLEEPVLAMQRRRSGRYRLSEAARVISDTGEREKQVLEKLKNAALCGELPMYEPSKSLRYTYGDGGASAVRDFWEEAYWSDLNKWLDEHEGRVAYRFPKPDASEWWSATLDAHIWSRRVSLTPREAATLLCGLNPLREAEDPDLLTNDETAPQDFRRLKRVFEDYGAREICSRSLWDWLEIAKSEGLKYHSWIDVWFDAHPPDEKLNEPEKIEPLKTQGLEKADILAAKWPLSGEFSVESLAKALSDVPDWLTPARVAPGARGGPSARWNPAMLAICLTEKRYANGKALDATIRRHFPQYLDQWERYNE